MDVERNGNVSPQGLTREEAELRVRQYGPNVVREAKPLLFPRNRPKILGPRTLDA